MIIWRPAIVLAADVLLPTEVDKAIFWMVALITKSSLLFKALQR